MTHNIPNNQTVWKRQLGRLTRQTIQLPKDATILTAQLQHNEIAIWFRCDRLAPLTPHTFLLATTDGHVPSNAQYISTIQLADGHLILHLFHLPNQSASQSTNQQDDPQS